MTSKKEKICDEVLERIKNGEDYENEKTHFTPSIIGFLLDYPLIYLISDDFDECKNSLNNSDLQLFKYYYKSVVITSYTVPFGLTIEPLSIPEMELKTEVINLPSVCL